MSNLIKTRAVSVPSIAKTKPKGSSPFQPIASVLLRRLHESNPNSKMDDIEKEMKKITQALNSLSASQTTLKRLDGVAHEAYQRTHSNSIDDDDDDDVEEEEDDYDYDYDGKKTKSKVDSATKVSGRLTRNAERAGCIADSLLACELCEIVDYTYDELIGEHGTLRERKVIYNETHFNVKDRNLKPLSVLVIHEPDYNGGAGLGHGGIDDLLDKSMQQYDNELRKKPRGRILIIISDRLGHDLVKTLNYLDSSSYQIGLSSGLVANEVASVHKGLYHAAGNILQAIQPVLDSISNSTGSKNNTHDEINLDDKSDTPSSISLKDDEKPAIHIVGRSLGGGIASIMATIIDGTLPMPELTSRKNSKRRKKSKKKQTDIDKHSNLDNETISSMSQVSISGYARGRTSAVALGPPPCLSPNIKASYITSVIHGDDVVPRTTRDSIDRLLSRTKKAMRSGFIGQKVGWVGVNDAMQLTFSSIKSHAHGSEGEEIRLAIPGKVFLVRPRRLGGASSIHEVGGVSGREAIRAAVLWQLNDVLLSRSLWTHHSLSSYIHGLDRVQLREFRSARNDQDEIIER